MDLARILTYAAERYPDAVALADGERSWTYAEWTARALKLADGLAGLGVASGDRVAIGMRNGCDHATAFFAAQLLGTVAVPFNFRMKQDGITHVLHDSGARVLLTDSSIAPEVAVGAAAGLGVQRVLAGDPAAASSGSPAPLSLEELLASGEPRERDHVQPEHLSTILYTSGTTGRPKGVPLTHGNAYHRVISYVSSAGPLFGSGARTLGAAPLYHTVGLHWVLCLTVYLNGTYFPLADLSAQSLSTAITGNELTFLFGSPTLYHMLLDDGIARNYPSVTGVGFGSAPMDAGLLAAMTAAFPNACINEVFGTTETSIPFVTRNVAQWPQGALRITADHRVRIVEPGSPDDDPVEVGQPGELLVDMRNEASFRGYWQAPDKTARSVRNGWYHTGDVFQQDGDGSYFIHGRLDDMFISGGENIMPLEIEQLLLAHPAVADAAVVGTPDARWGKVVTAYLVAKQPLSSQQVDEYCRGSSLEDFKRPRRIVFVDTIPRNPSGKIVRGELLELLEQSTALAGSVDAETSI